MTRLSNEPEIEKMLTHIKQEYSVQRELGRGGMGLVFAAEDLTLGRHVVIKVMRPDIVSSINIDRFFREAKIVAKLSHPNIVPLYSVGKANGIFYYTMPHLRGETIRHRLDRIGSLPINKMLRFVAEISDALDYTHRHGIVHRDIKPENILIQNEHAVVLDFGIAAAAATPAVPKFTAPGSILGTSAYMSPEQAAGDKIDARSDLFALGCVTYEMLVGRPPFTGITGRDVICKLFSLDPAPVEDLPSNTPPEVVEAITRALIKDPALRLISAAEFRDIMIKARKNLHNYPNP